MHRIVEADVTFKFPESPPLFTEESFTACWRPDPSKDGTEEHWHFFRALPGPALRSFGFPAALKGAAAMKPFGAHPR